MALLKLYNKRWTRNPTATNQVNSTSINSQVNNPLEMFQWNRWKLLERLLSTLQSAMHLGSPTEVTDNHNKIMKNQVIRPNINYCIQELISMGRQTQWIKVHHFRIDVTFAFYILSHWLKRVQQKLVQESNKSSTLRLEYSLKINKDYVTLWQLICIYVHQSKLSKLSVPLQMGLALKSDWLDDFNLWLMDIDLIGC